MITCNQHDFIEIACLYHYKIKLKLIDASYVKGIALDTIYDENKKHCLKIQTSCATQLIILNDIVHMQALAKNPHFTLIEFNQ